MLSQVSSRWGPVSYHFLVSPLCFSLYLFTFLSHHAYIANFHNRFLSNCSDLVYVNNYLLYCGIENGPSFHFFLSLFLSSPLNFV